MPEKTVLGRNLTGERYLELLETHIDPLTTGVLEKDENLNKNVPTF